jgi:CHAT domain-containing protein
MTRTLELLAFRCRTHCQIIGPTSRSADCLSQSQQAAGYAQSFLDQLKKGNISKAEALQQAQITLINANNKADSNGKRSSIEIEVPNSGVSPGTVNRLSHPYYWAPFILIGNGL